MDSNEQTSKIDKIIQENPTYFDLVHNDKIVRLNTRPNIYVIDYITVNISLDNNFYEFELLQDIEKKHPKHKTILDIGANIGNHACFFENFLEYEKLICFEPNSENFKVLCSNLHLSKSIAFPVAVSDKPGLGSLVNPLWYNYGTFQLVPGNNVSVIVLDDFLDQHNIKDVTLMKIDVENHELNVLKGAKRLLERDHPTIYVELWDNIKNDVFDFLNTFGYKFQSVICSDGCPNYKFC